MGLYGKAFWHLQNPSQILTDEKYSKTKVWKAAFESKSTVAWLSTLLQLKPESKLARSSAVKLIRKGLTLLTSTTNVERWLHQLQLQEIKKGSSKLSVAHLEALIKLNVQCLTGRRVGTCFNPNELIRDSSQQTKTMKALVQCRPSQYGLRCQNVYREFFGERRSTGRKLNPSDSSGQLLKKPKLGAVGRQSDKTVAASLSTHDASVQLAKRTLLGDVAVQSDADMLQWGVLAAAVTEVAAARRETAVKPRKLVDESLKAEADHQEVAPVSDKASNAVTGISSSSCAEGSSSLPQLTPDKETKHKDKGQKKSDEKAAVTEEDAKEDERLKKEKKKAKKKDKKDKKDKKEKKEKKDKKEKRDKKTKKEKKTNDEKKSEFKQPVLGSTSAPLESANKKKVDVTEAASQAKDKTGWVQPFAANASSTKSLEKLDRQLAVANIQKAVASEAKFNKPLTYVTATGGLMSGSSSSRCNVLEADLSAVPAKPLPDDIKIFTVDGASFPPWIRFEKRDVLKRSDVVLVSSLEKQFYCPELLAARLYGKRVADEQWAFSRMKSGTCHAFQPARLMHLYCWISNEVAEQFPKHLEVLKAASDFTGSAASSSNPKRLHVAVGDLPEKPLHPRLSYGVVTQEAWSKLQLQDQRKFLTMEGLISRLTSLHSPAAPNR